MYFILCTSPHGPLPQPLAMTLVSVTQTIHPNVVWSTVHRLRHLFDARLAAAAAAAATATALAPGNWASSSM